MEETINKENTNYVKNELRKKLLDIKHQMTELKKEEIMLEYILKALE